MTTDNRMDSMDGQQRRIEVARPQDEDLGPLRLLPGTWVSQGRGWNSIALPFATPGPLDYRLLLNQFDETLTFTLVDKGVPNRGVSPNHAQQRDQFIVTLDYEQVVHQVAVVDEPASTVRGAVGAAIHHEPGLFLNLLNRIPEGFDIARLATIPHGDSVLALGTSSVVDGLAPVRPVSGLPVGVSDDVDANPYLAPYKHFRDNPFKGVLGAGFPGFDPTAPHELLLLGTQGQTVTRTTVLDLDSTHPTGGIANVPFVERQADAASMRSTFWIQELAPDAGGEVTLQLQYVQVVMLDFFPRRDGLPGRIGWPHVSINTLTKVTDEPASPEDMVTPQA